MTSVRSRENGGTEYSFFRDQVKEHRKALHSVHEQIKSFEIKLMATQVKKEDAQRMINALRDAGDRIKKPYEDVVKECCEYETTLSREREKYIFMRKRILADIADLEATDMLWELKIRDTRTQRDGYQA